MFLPGLIGLGSKTKGVRLGKAGAWVGTSVIGVTQTIDTIVDNLEVRPNAVLVLFIGINMSGNTDVTNVTRNGAAFTEFGAPTGSNNDHQFSCWYRLNPVASDGAGVVITLDTAATASDRVSIAWAYLYGVNQTTPLNTAVTSNSTANNPVLTATPTGGSVNGYPLAAVFGWDNTGGVDWTSGAGQVRLATSATDNEAGTAIDTETPAASQSFTITGQITTTYDANIRALTVNPF